MSRMALPSLACSRCGAAAGPDAAHTGCRACSAEGIPANLTTVYDAERVAHLLDPSALHSRPFNMWRYQALLPVAGDAIVTLGEGGTPLLNAPRLAGHLGLRRLRVKDETRNPTWSFKDRAAALTASIAKTTGTRALVVSSTGNAGAATAAYARRAGLLAIALMTTNVDPLMRSFVTAYEPYAIAAPTKAQRWVLMRHCVMLLQCYPNSNFQVPPLGNNPYAVDGYKTISFEIWEQLGHRAPEWVFLPVGYGDGLFGTYKGFSELAAAGLSRMPRLGAGEVSGSLTQTMRSTSDRLHSAGNTNGTIGQSISNPQSTYQALAALRKSNGSATTVSNEELSYWQRLLASTEGLSIEISSAAAFAALAQQLDAGAVRPDDDVVVVATSSGLKSGVVAQGKHVQVPVATSHAELERVLRETYGCDLASASEGER